MSVEISEESQPSRLPSDLCLKHATKIAIVQDKPIMYDYWSDSIGNSCFIGVKENEEKLLVKNEDEYTSPIAKIYKVDGEYLIMTENSLYVVDAKIATRRIQ
jgi:hypothetical protein|tara:strand:+ start:3521 stop:3826 length:306 start_codon:yes stop_codon:yes gene_type:complete